MSKTTKLRPSQGGKMHAPMHGGCSDFYELRWESLLKKQIIAILLDKLAVSPRDVGGKTWDEVADVARKVDSVCDLEKEIAALKGEISGWKKSCDEIEEKLFDLEQSQGVDDVPRTPYADHIAPWLGAVPECDINRQSFVDLSRDPDAEINHRRGGVYGSAVGK